MRILSFTLLLFSTVLSFGQNWTLDRCIQHALENNIGIKQSEVQTQKAVRALNNSKFERLPSISANLNHNYNVGRSIDPWTNTFSNKTIQSNAASVNASWVLFAGNRVNNTIKLNELGLQVQKKALESTQNSVSLSVASAFLQLILAQENLKVATQQVELTRTQVDRMSKLVSSGAENQGNLLNMKAQLASDEIQEVNAKNQVELSRLSLMNLLQLDMSKPFEITYPVMDIPDTEATDPDELFRIAMDHLPEIQQARLQVDQAQISRKIATASYIPSLAAYGNLNTVYSESGFETFTDGFQLLPIGYLPSTQEQVYTSLPITKIVAKPFADQLRDNFGQSFGFALSVPVFNNMRNRNAVEAASLNTQLSRLNFEQSKNQLKTDVVTAHTNYTSAASSYRAAVSNEEAQRTNYQYNVKRFEAGLLNPTDLLLAKNRWHQAQQQLLTTKYELIFRQLIIAYYKGNTLTLP